MAASLDVSVAVAKIVRGCYVAGDDFASLRTRLLARIRRVVSIEAAFFATADPETLLFTSAWAEAPLAAAAAHFMGNEFGAANDVNRFASLARAKRPLATLDLATAGERGASLRYREILSPLGLGDELRVALRSADTTWGFLCLHRSGTLGFSARDVAILQQVAPHVGEALRRIVADSLATPLPLNEPAVVMTDNHVVVGMTAKAQQTLTELHGSCVDVGDAVPVSLLSVIQKLEALESTVASTELAQMTIATRAGQLIEVHAARMQLANGRGAIALTLAPAGVAARASLLLAARGLTPAQRRVAALVVQGLSTREIVTTLHIGEHTVQDHLKAVFEKTGVSSRRELVTSLLRG